MANLLGPSDRLARMLRPAVGGLISEYTHEVTLIKDSASASASAASGAAPPPATQIGYSDPRAENVRKLVLKRMRGEPCDEADMTIVKEERMTVMEFDRGK